MFRYDDALLKAVAAPVKTIPEVLATMRAIDGILPEGDGLKWFSWLYLQVTEDVEARVGAGGFHDPSWLAALDVAFANLYFDALYAARKHGDRADSVCASRDQRAHQPRFAAGGRHDVPGD